MSGIFFYHSVKFIEAESENGGKDGHKTKPAAKQSNQNDDDINRTGYCPGN
jgi:hypothetical protein